MTTRPVSCRIRPHSAVLIIRTVLLLGALILGGATDALAQGTGTISGKVTNAALVPLPNTELWFFDFNSAGDGLVATATTDAQGDYSVNLPPGQYAIFTQNVLGYINEAYPNFPCSAVCNLESITPFTLNSGATFVANFALDPGGRIAGRVTDSGTGLGIQGVTVWFVPFDGEGLWFSKAITDANGDYISEGGTITGTIFAFTMNGLGYQNEVWNNVKCGGCDVTEVGTEMHVTIGVTTGGFDFALDAGGRISGTVRDSNLNPLSHVEITIYDSSGQGVEFAETDQFGNYTSGGLIAGNYYVSTQVQNGIGLVDEVWNGLTGVTCVNGFCDPRNGGTLIPVTVGGHVTDINFTLAPGGRITGTVTNSATGLPVNDYVFVNLVDASGQFIGGAYANPEAGQYTMRGVPPGTYYATAGYAGFFTQMYNGLTCINNCPALQSTPIHVTVGATTANINFALVPTTSVGTISGTVRDVTLGAPGTTVNNMQVQLLSLTGVSIAFVATNGSGVYTFSNLPVGSYYVRTSVGNQLINQLHDGVVCVNCNVTTSGGTPVPVTAGATTTINFNLTAGVQIRGTVTNAVGGGNISGIAVQVFSAAGVNLGQTSTNGSGVYTTRGLPDGTYYLRTSNNLGYVDKLYDNQVCPGPGCAVLNGTPVVAAGAGTIVGGKNFVLAQGGRISGAVTGPAGMNIQFQTNVTIFTDTGTSLGNTPLIDAAGNYNSFALPSGRYYLRSTNTIGLLDELFDNLPCPGQCSITSGTPVDVTAGATTSGKNFSLTAGGSIGGTVRDANTNALLNSIRVQAFLADGTLVKGAVTNANGEYAIIGLAPGTYYLKTGVVGAAVFYLDELYNEIPCPLACTLTDGTPVVVTAGMTEGGKNFTLTAGGGIVSGTVRDTAGNLLGGVSVQIHLADGTLVKQVGTGGNGVFSATLPAGTYYARTMLSGAGAYLDELFNELPCTPTCNVAAGAQIIVVNSATQGGVDFTLAPNLVKNGRFESGTSSWVLFSTPDPTYLVSQITNGVFEYYRVPPPAGTTNQAVIFQETGVALPANAPVLARFSIGNSSSVRKRISVLMLDSNFGDLSVCTFFLPPNTPMAPYRMITHTTQAWTNAAIYFYAASAGSNGGFYQLDNVSIESAPTESAVETTCVDPLAPAPVIVPPGPDLLVNGNFNTGTLAPWGTFGNIQGQVTAGVFEFIKLPGLPAGVVLQATGQAIPANTILTATFQLGNSSAVRKRVTVLLHDNLFGDLSACTFWLAPGQPLSDYAYRTYTTQAWANATVSVYPATTGPDQWIRLDNVTLRTTRSTLILGTECIEPGGSLAPSESGAGLAQGAATIAAGTPAAQNESGSGPQILQSAMALDLRAASSAVLAFESWLTTAGAWGEVQVKGEDGEWQTVRIVGPSDVWRPMAIDLTDYLGQMVDVRFVLYSATGAAPEIWRIRNSGS
jgi:hypothetical protein